MLEWTPGIRAVGKELAVLLGIVGEFLRRRWVACGAFAVLAGGAERAMVGDVDGGTWRSDGRLMCEFAVFVCAGQVEFAGGVWRRRFVGGSESHVHWRYGCSLWLFLLEWWSAISLLACSQVGILMAVWLNTVK